MLERVRARRNRLEDELDRQVTARERDLRIEAIHRRTPPLPPSPFDHDYNPHEGFMPVEQAATAMGTSVPELRRLVADGRLEGRLVRGAVLVRPAIVTVMRVRDERPEPEFPPAA